MATRPTPRPIEGTPDFGKSVIILDRAESNDTLNQKINAVRQISKIQTDDGSEFAPNRYAIFFKKGVYDLYVPNVYVGMDVGYYMTVHGLGDEPDKVTINGQVRSPGSFNPAHLGLALNNFWRGVENLAVKPTDENGNEQNQNGPVPNRWAVSQATFMRRVHVTGKGNLWLFDLHPVEGGDWPAGESSGGFIADSLVNGIVTSGSQQQFLTRNVSLNGGWVGGLWNMVFVGDEHPPPGSWADLPSEPDDKKTPYTTITTTPVIREKPYLTCSDDGKYTVQVPPLHREGVAGVSWSRDKGKGKTIPISQCFIAKAGTLAATAAELNKRLNEGYHLILTPGIYHLDQSLVVNHKDTVILGLGMATLVPDGGTPVMIIADVGGVSVGGLILDAGLVRSPSLLVVGYDTLHGLPRADHKDNPTALFDCSARVGNGEKATASNCFTVNSNDVILDNVWIWRADHGRMGTHDPSVVGWQTNPAQNGLIVNGDRVVAYGLFVEHFQAYETIWNGNDGQVYFYQSEIPYDVPDQNTWRQQPNQKGFASYKVSDQVTSHTASGLGVYCNFSNNVQLDSAIEIPDLKSRPNIKMTDMCTVWLDGADGSGINHVVDGKQAAGWEVKSKGSPVLRRGDVSRVLTLEVQEVEK